MKLTVSMVRSEGMTHARARYLKEQNRIAVLLRWYIESAIDLDDAVRNLTKLKRQVANNEDSGMRPKELYLGAGAVRKIASAHQYQLMSEMTLCRVVDNYLCYITDLLGLLFKSRPDCLKSSEEVTLEFVLTHKTRSRLIHAIVDRQVDKLSRRGMRDLNDYTTRRLGLPLFSGDSQLSRAVELVETRNLIVHARGIVDEVFLSRIGNPQRELGSRLSFSFSSVIDHAGFMAECVSELEQRAHDKFDFSMPIRFQSSC